MAVHNEERKFRLLAFFTYIEDKHAASIQRAYRARVWPPARESSRFVAGDELGEVPTEPDLYGGFLPSRFVRIVVGSDEVRDSCARGIPPTMDEFKEARLVEDVPNGSETSLPRFGKPTGQLTAQLQMVAEEIALRRGATLLRRFSRQAIKHDLHNNLKGVLWKRNYRIPRFQRRAVYVTPIFRLHRSHRSCSSRSVGLSSPLMRLHVSTSSSSERMMKRSAICGLTASHFSYRSPTMQITSHCEVYTGRWAVGSRVCSGLCPDGRSSPLAEEARQRSTTPQRGSAPPWLVLACGGLASPLSRLLRSRYVS